MAPTAATPNCISTTVFVSFVNRCQSAGSHFGTRRVIISARNRPSFDPKNLKPTGFPRETHSHNSSCACVIMPEKMVQIAACKTGTHHLYQDAQIPGFPQHRSVCANPLSHLQLAPDCMNGILFGILLDTLEDIGRPHPKLVAEGCN